MLAYLDQNLDNLNLKGQLENSSLFITLNYIVIITTRDKLRILEDESDCLSAFRDALLHFK